MVMYMHASRKIKEEKGRETNVCVQMCSCVNVCVLADMHVLRLACLPCSESHLRRFRPSASLCGLKGAEAENSHTLKLMRVLDAVREQCELVFLRHPLDINRLVA